MGRSAEVVLLSCRSCFQSFTPAGRAGWGLVQTLEGWFKGQHQHRTCRIDCARDAL